MQYIDELAHDWNDLKRRTVRFIGLTAKSITLQKMTGTLATCGDVLAFVPDENGELRFRSSWFCRNRLCPMCIKRRSLKQYAEACRLVDAMPEGTWLHLVLTVPNVSFEELGNTISRMNKASSNFFRDKEIKRAFRGVLRVLEVTYNAIRNDWHPHFHCLIWAPKSYCTNPKLYLKRERLLELWAAVVGLPVRQIYISRIKDPLTALPEVVKYCFKPYEPNDKQGLSEVEFYERIYSSLHGRRCIQTYGIIREKVRDLRLDLEGENSEDPPAPGMPGVLLLKYDHNKRRYTTEQ